MIIHRVQSENVLKYATLDLNDLPAQGLIGLSGANESGKSTIGETLCFALFGRTYAYTEDEIVNVIRWGEPSCAVSVEFSINGHRYAVSRFLDDKGNQGVRLNDHREALLARGVEPVRDALEALLDFGFDEFVESFYLAQREITTPHPHSTAVKKMAGIAALEQVATDANVESRHEQGTISAAESAIADTEQHIAGLNLEASLLSRLESQHDDLCRLQNQGSEHITALQGTTEHYQDSRRKIKSAVETFRQAEVDTTYPGWRTHVHRFEAGLDGFAQQHQADAMLTSMVSELEDFARGAEQHLSAFGRLRDSANAYRGRLADLLGEASEARAHDQPAIEPLRDTQAWLQTQLADAVGRRTKLRVGVYVFLLLALVVWAAWGLSTQASGSGMAQTISAWRIDAAWLLLAAGGLSGLFVLLGFRSLRLGSKIAQLRQSSDDVDVQIAEARRQADALDVLDDTPLPQAVSTLARLEDADISAEALRFQQDMGADLIDAAKLDRYHAQLHSLKDRFESNVLSQCEAFAAQIKTIQDDMATRQTTIGQLHEHITQEQARHQTLNEFKVAATIRQEQIEACNHRIQVRDLARDLLARGAQHIATTFNRDIRDLVSRTLPLLTQGRYEHLRIDENLDVQVFSNEKRDYMQFEEISTGTQRQIMLAVRLALSQQFINTTLGRRQFIFLDEPFAFFDEERTRSTLQALPKLSNELSQIWIVAQSFPEGFAFDLDIRCQQDSDVLTPSQRPSP